MDNTNIEIQPTVTGTAEALVVSAEVRREVGGLADTSVVPVVEASPETKPVSSESIEGSVEVKAATEAPKPSAGFPLSLKSTGTSRIVLEKLMNTVANL